MINRDYTFTSESVSEGHPDKMADQISDAILDNCLAQDPKSRVACETMISTGFVTIAGEISSQAKLDAAEIVRKTIKGIGYDCSDKGFDYKTCAVFSALDQQSSDIAMGIDREDAEIGAGDQGIMFGYAVNENEEYMPLSLSLSHRLVQNLAQMRKSAVVGYLRPDSKSQVSVAYEKGKPKAVTSVVLSTQHSSDVTQGELRQFIEEELIRKTIPKKLLTKSTKFYINPTGRFVIGGPHGDCGLTGRKIIVDTYGGHGAHGGGAFSGKDATKVDRSAAYALRHVAKNLVATGYLDQCLVQASYAIGVAHPISLMVNDYGTGKVLLEVLEKAVKEVWSLKPVDIIEEFHLLEPKFQKTAAYGHFGRSEEDFTWEKLNKVEALKDAIKVLS